MQIRYSFALFAGMSMGVGILAAARMHLPETDPLYQPLNRVINVVDSVSPVALLSNQKGQALVVVSSTLQGRVLTSTLTVRMGAVLGG